MARYFFHLKNYLDVPDEEGQEFPDEAAACERAVEEARVQICESIRQHGNVNMNHAIIVTDRSGAELCTVTFREAFRIVG